MNRKLRQTNMKYASVPGIDKPVSRLVQGTVMLDPGKPDEALALLDAVFEAGCTAFDTAHVYGGGNCERLFGRWVNDRDIRREVVLLDKGAHHDAERQRVTPADITADLHESLERLQFDSIDLYMLHRDNPVLPVGPIVEVLNEHCSKGLIGAFGGSNWSHERLQEADEYAEAHGLTPFVAASPNYSLAEMVIEPWENCVAIGGPAKAAARQWYQTHHMPIFAWSSLAAGFMTGRTCEQIEAMGPGSSDPAVRCFGSEANLERLRRAGALATRAGLTVPQIALGFLFSQPLEVFALVGCESGAQFRENAKALGVRLTPNELEWLDLQRDEL